MKWEKQVLALAICAVLLVAFSEGVSAIDITAEGTNADIITKPTQPIQKAISWLSNQSLLNTTENTIYSTDGLTALAWCKDFGYDIGPDGEAYLSEALEMHIPPKTIGLIESNSYYGSFTWWYWGLEEHWAGHAPVELIVALDHAGYNVSRVDMAHMIVHMEDLTEAGIIQWKTAPTISLLYAEDAGYTVDKTTVQNAIDSLETMQEDDGSWDKGNPYYTGLALYTLLMGENGGYTVSQVVIQDAIAFLEDYYTTNGLKQEDGVVVQALLKAEYMEYTLNVSTDDLVSDLVSLQNEDGSWAPEIGPSFIGTYTAHAVKALLLYGEIQPSVSISTDEFKYSPGDTMTITIGIANPTEDSITFQWYWGVPQYSVWKRVRSAPIPAGYVDTVDLSFTIPNLGPKSFGNVFYVQLLDKSGEVLDADAACWAYSPGGKAMPQVDIAEEIKKTVERIRIG